MKTALVIFVAATALAGTITAPAQNSPNPATPQEHQLHNVRQLTFGGQNAESYFSADGTRLIFQSSHGNVKCDQIFIMNIDGTDQHMVSTGKGRTTCSYFYPDGKKNSLLLHPSCQP